MNKTSLLIFAAIAVLLALANTQTNRAQVATAPVGRYQLFAGEHVQLGSPTDMKDVFRIDTATGRAMIYSYGTSTEGKFVNRWSPID